jgi:uncharacterized protein YbbK (DUF523 family)
MDKKKLLVSSCLLGELVKYNGSHNGFEQEVIDRLEEKYEIYSFCPEVEGGLPTPRTPCEIISQKPIKVINKEGSDKTKEFILGANKTLELCQKENIKLALLKENSPSCSNTHVNDGTFSRSRIEGLGVAAKLLIENGIQVFNEKQIKKLI